MGGPTRLSEDAFTVGAVEVERLAALQLRCSVTLQCSSSGRSS